jgi:ribokinase
VIVVVGSVNLDTVVSVEELPRPGETVTAARLATAHGGKGANQAIAAARLGGDVTFIGALGSDSEADILRESLAKEGIGVDHVTSIPGTRSGVALITVDGHGENLIVVYPGANGDLALTDHARSAIQSADVVLMQLEIPMSTVVAAARLARGTVIVNAAPARSLSDELVGCIDVLVVNEHERAVVHEAGNAARIPVTITTVGADGADLASRDGTQRVPAPVVNVVDTTGAGDTFCGALAEALDRGEPIIDAVGWAVRAGALSTTELGARTAMPTREMMVDQLREKT